MIQKCLKYDLGVTGCSKWQGGDPEEICGLCEKDHVKKTTSEAQICSICKQEVLGNVNPEKVLTCSRCVQGLLGATKENKITLRNDLLDKGDTEGVRSMESFIVPEEDTHVATFETTYRKRASNRLLHRVKGSLNARLKPIADKRRIDGKANEGDIAM